jgi:hypothetical protein
MLVISIDLQFWSEFGISLLDIIKFGSGIEVGELSIFERLLQSLNDAA